MNSISLSQLALLLGGLGVAASVWQLLAPAQVRRMLDALPRHVPTAWALTALDLLWVAWLLKNTPLGSFDYLKPSLYIVAPLCFFLLIQYMDELLAVRALGGFLLLLANPVLKITQWHPSEWRLVVTAMAYGWVLIGMVLVMSPHRFRRTVNILVPDDARGRLSALAKLAVSALLIGLAFLVY